MKHGLLVTAHRDFEQLRDLVSFFDMDFEIYLHLDKKCNFSEEEIKNKAIAKIAQLTALPPYGITVVKKNRVEAMRSKYEAMRQTDSELFLDCWFNPEVQELLKAAAKKF